MSHYSGMVQDKRVVAAINGLAESGLTHAADQLWCLLSTPLPDAGRVPAD
jgi:hypothetical protein